LLTIATSRYPLRGKVKKSESGLLNRIRGRSSGRTV